MDKQPFFCECSSVACRQMVHLEPEEVMAIREKGLVIIARGCKPDPGDKLVESRHGYDLYSESTESPS